MTEETEVAVAQGNRQTMFELIHDTGERQTSISEIVYDRSGGLSHGRQ